MNTECIATLVDSVQAVGCAYTGANICFLTGHNLTDDVRVRHMCPGHADHVDQPGRYRMAGGGYIRYACGMEYW